MAQSIILLINRLIAVGLIFSNYFYPNMAVKKLQLIIGIASYE